MQFVMSASDDNPTLVLGFDLSTQSFTATIARIEKSAEPAVFRLQPVATHAVHFGTELPQYGSPSGYIADTATVASMAEEPADVKHAHPHMWLEALDVLLGKFNGVGVWFGGINK